MDLPDDTVQDIYQCLASTLSAGADRAHAEKRLKDYLQLPGFLLVLFQILTAEEVQFEVRLAASLYFKNSIKNRWDGSRSPEIVEEERSQIRDNIIEAIIRVPRKVRLPLEDVIKEVCQVDFPDKFPDFVDRCMRYIHSGDAQSIFGAVVSLEQLAFIFSFRGRDRRGALDEVVKMTFPTLRDLLAQLMEMEVTEESSELQQSILQIFWHSFQMVNPEWLQDPDVIVPWLEHFVRIATSAVPEEVQPEDHADRPEFILWELKVSAFEILNRYFTRYGNPKLSTPEQAPFAKWYSENIVVSQLEQYIAVMSDWLQGMYLPPRVLNLIYNFFDAAVRQSITFRAMRPHLELLWMQGAFRLLSFTDEDAFLWTEAPYDYINKHTNVLEDFVSPVMSATNFTIELVKVRTKYALAPITGFCYEVLETYSNNPTVENAYAKDGALAAIGAISEKLKITPGYMDRLEEMIVTYVLPEFNSEHGFLRARAVNVCGQFHDIAWSSMDVYEQVLLSTRGTLHDPDLPVRIFGATAFQRLILLRQSTEIIRPILGDVIAEFFDMMHEIDNDDVIVALDNLIGRYGSAMAEIGGDIARHLAESFFRMLNSEDEIAGLAAVNCLSALHTLVFVLRNHPATLLDVQEATEPLIRRLCGDDGIDFFEEVLELIRQMIVHAQVVSPLMWSYFPLLRDAYFKWAIDYMHEMLPCLTTYIHYGTEDFVQADGGAYIGMVCDMVQTTLTDPECHESYNIEVLKLAQSVILFCRDAIDQLVPTFIELALERLGSAKTWGLRVTLLEVVFVCLYYNPQIAVSKLEDMGAVASFFDAWKQLLEHMSRMHSKKVCIVGATSLFALPMDQCPESMQGCMKMVLETLLETVAALDTQIGLMDEELANGSDDSDWGTGADGEDWGDDEGLDENEDLFDEQDLRYLEKLEKNATMYHAYFNDVENNDVAVDDNFYTPLDEVNEFDFFLAAMEEFSNVQGDAYAALTSLLTDDYVQIFERSKVRAEIERQREAEEAQQAQAIQEQLANGEDGDFFQFKHHDKVKMFRQ